MRAEPADVEINGARLRELRKLNGDDLKSFATRAGISLQYLSQLELGRRRRVSPPTFARICDALGIDNRRELVMPCPPEARNASGPTPPAGRW